MFWRLPNAIFGSAGLNFKDFGVAAKLAHYFLTSIVRNRWTERGLQTIEFSDSAISAMLDSIDGTLNKALQFEFFEIPKCETRKSLEPKSQITHFAFDGIQFFCDRSFDNELCH